MKGDTREEHLQCMEAARRACAVRNVHGRAYPVPLGEFKRWEEERAVLFSRRRHPTRREVRLYARKIFKGAP